MRIFAFLLLCLPAAAYLSHKNPAAQPAAAAPAAVSQASAQGLVFQSADNGATWQDFSHGLPEGLELNSVLIQGETFIVGTRNSVVYRSTDLQKGAWEREDIGKAFLNTQAIFPDEYPITGIFPGHAGPYICLYQGGFFRRNADDGLWQPMHKSLNENTIHAVAESPDGTIFVGTPGGIYKSSDDGTTWQHVFKGGWVSSLAESGGVLVGGAPEGLVRSTDGGEHWERVLSDPGAAYQASAIEQGFAAVRAAGPWNKCDAIEAILLRTSTDGGKTWQRMDEGLAVAEGTYVFEKATSPITAISDFEQFGKYLFCSHQTGISRSADGGKTWQLVLPAPVSGKPWVFELSKSGQTIVAALRWGGC